MESPRLLSPRGDGSVIDAPGCGSTSLHWACANGRVEDVEALLAAGRGVGARDGGGRTPLHWAVLKGRGAVARALLDAGADAGAADDSGRTALMAAARAAAREWAAPRGALGQRRAPTPTARAQVARPRRPRGRAPRRGRGRGRGGRRRLALVADLVELGAALHAAEDG